MSEKDKRITSTQRDDQDSGEALAESSRAFSQASAGELRRQRTLRRASLTFALAAIMSAAVYLLIYLQTQTWQNMAETGMAVIAAALCLVAWRLARGRHLDLASYLLLSAPVLLLPASALFLSGLVFALSAGVLVIVPVLGNLMLPRQQRRYAIAIGVVGAGATLLIEQFVPWSRYDVNQHPLLQVFAPGIVVLITLTALWQLARIYRHTETIRVRLLLSFVSLVLLPSVIINVVSIVSFRQDAEQRTITQLESVVALKEAEIEAWLEDLQTILALILIGEDVKLNTRVLLGEDVTAFISGEAAHDRLIRQFNDVIREAEHLDELFIMDSQGKVILSTDIEQKAKVYINELFFERGWEGPFVQPPTYDLAVGHTVIVVHPIVGSQGRSVGVLAGRASREKLNQIMSERSGLDETGETYLVSANYTLLTESRFVGYIPGTNVRTDEGISAALQDHTSAVGVYDDYRAKSTIGVYSWIPQLEAVLAAKQDRTGLRGIAQTMYLNIGVTIALLGIAIITARQVTQDISAPLADLAQAATKIAAGDLKRVVKVGRDDEVADLARAFNDMTTQLRGLVGELEQRVAERTQSLERRSVYLEASAEVGRAAASILDTSRLVRQVVELVRERFGLYYVGLFRVDETGEWAVLRAGTGIAGYAMLQRGHRIKVGEGMIGWSVANAEARIASQAEADAVRLTTSELPDTRSEAAIPLRSRGRVMGALTVQSSEPDAFDEALLTVLQTVGDQVAVALDNARLFAESQAAVDAQRRAYGEISQEAWEQLLRARSARGFSKSEQGVVPLTDSRQLYEAGGGLYDPGGSTHLLYVTRPISVREQVIGMVNARKSMDSGQWTAEEVNLLETLINRLAEALEGARLHEEAQRRAQREQLARQITEKVRAAPDVESIAQTAAEELVKAIGGARSFVRLSADVTDVREPQSNDVREPQSNDVREPQSNDVREPQSNDDEASKPSP